MSTKEQEAQQAEMIEGVYQCKCSDCREFFNGHKRAVVCPNCMRKRTEGLGFPWSALIPPLIGLCAGIYMGAKL